LLEGNWVLRGIGSGRGFQKDDQELLAMMQRAAQLGAGNKSVARR
jgi:hypothetical protein